MKHDTRAARPPAEFDAGGQRLRIGLIVLSTDLSVEQDFFAMLPDRGIGIYSTRISFTNPTTRENLLAMRPRLGKAAELILPGMQLDSIAFACTSASALIGNETVIEAVQRGKPGTPCVTPTTAVAAAYRVLGLKNLTVVAPYLRQVSENLCDSLGDMGVSVKSLHFMDIADDRDIGRVSLESLEKIAINASADGADALFLSCTGLRAVPLLDRLEQKLGIAVLSSNQVLFWQALRCAGHRDPIHGFGQLLGKA